MALDFAGSNDRLEYSGAVIPSIPYTVSLWFYADGLADDILFNHEGAGNDIYFQTRSDGDLRFSVEGSGADTTTNYSSGVWNHGAFVCASTTSRTVYLNGGGSATATSSRTHNATSTTTRLGEGVTANQDYNGKMAEFAVWTVALDAAEVAALAAGCSPLLIRPGSLYHYLPMWSASHLNDWIQGVTWTLDNDVTTYAHPPIIYPSGLILPAKLGFQTIEASVTEALELNDTKSASLILPASVTEALELDDTQSETLILPASVTESLELDDTQVETAEFQATTSDDLTLNDTHSEQAEFQAATTDSLALDDTQSETRVLPVSTSDSLNLDDTQSASLVLQVSITETIELDDTQAETLTLAAAVTETLELDDVQSSRVVFIATVTETLELGDSHTEQAEFQVSVTEGLTLDDTWIGINVTVAAVDFLSGEFCVRPLLSGNICNRPTLSGEMGVGRLLTGKVGNRPLLSGECGVKPVLSGVVGINA